MTTYRYLHVDGELNKISIEARMFLTQRMFKVVSLLVLISFTVVYGEDVSIKYIHTLRTLTKTQCGIH